METPRTSYDEDMELCIRAAWLHYAGGLTQGEVAKRLGIPSVKAHRLVARANRNGLVRVTIDGDIAECIQLEERLKARYGLGLCEVAPDLDETGLPLKTLSIAGSRFLRLALEQGEHAVIGFGHGRTLAACVSTLPRMQVRGTRFVSLLGGLTRRFSTTPYDVIHRLVERTEAEAYVLPLPFYANTVEDRAVLLDQRGVAPVVEMGVKATLRLVGIGSLDDGASIVSTGMIEREEFDEARASGGVGEVLGHILDLSGRLIENGLSARTLSMAAKDIGSQKTVAIAGGLTKVDAIRAALSSGLIFGIITDERTAKALVA